MPKIAFTEAGKMASAMLRGILSKNHFSPQDLACTCKSGESGPLLARETGIIYEPNIEPVPKQSPIPNLFIFKHLQENPIN